MKWKGGSMMQFDTSFEQYRHVLVASDAQLQVNYCGCNRYASDYSIIRPHGTPDFQLIYFWEGCGYFRRGIAYEKVEEGNLLLLNPNEPQISVFYEKDNALVYSIHFTGRDAVPLLSDNGLNGRGPFRVGKHNEIRDVFHSIIREMQVKACKYEEICNASLRILLSQIARCRSLPARADKKYQKLLGVLEQMHTDFASQTSIEEYAQMCYLNKCYFITLFKEFTGVSPHTYKTGIRLERAKEYLSGTNLTVCEIASSIGFSDAVHFSKLFKKHTGMTPGDYRKKHQNNNYACAK